MTASGSIYIVKDAPGKGRGMFATRDIQRGECIISEDPLVYVGPDTAETLAAIDVLSKKNKKSFYALHNVHPDMSPELGIARTNSLPLGADAVDRAVFRVISRINHSCAPNVNHVWGSRTKKEHVYAVRDIAEGDELMTCYTDPLFVREVRKKFLLNGFKFDCQCTTCAASSIEHDAALRRIDACFHLIPQNASFNPKMSIQYVREALSLLDTIGLLCCKTPYYYDGFQICATYSDYKHAQEWADLMLESCRMEGGEEGSKYEKYLRYSKNPRSFERAGTGGRQILS